MKQFMRNLWMFAKQILSDHSFSFWVLLYPIILVTIMYAGLSQILNEKITIEPVKVAVVGQQPIAQVFEQIDFFEERVVDTEQEAEQLLASQQVVGYVTKDTELVVGKTSGQAESMLKQVVTEVLQAQALGSALLKIDFQAHYLKTQELTVSPAQTIFFATFVSLAFYSMFSGVVVTEFLNSSVSQLGRRIVMSTYPRWQLLVLGMLTALGLNLFSNAVLLVYATFVLKLELFSNWPATLLLLFFVNLVGIAFGLAIGTIQRLSLNARVIVVLNVNLVLATCAGMMGNTILHLINLYAPVVNQWNPFAIVSRGLYQINVTQNFTKLPMIYSALACYGVVAFGWALIRLRKSRHQKLEG